jgi:hypothetical protein
MPEFSRRRLIGEALGGAAAACTLGGASAAAEAAVLPSRSGLPWASGARDSYPDAFVADYRGGRKLDTLMTFAKKRTWAEIRNSGNGNYVNLLGPTRQNRQEAIVVSYPLFPIEQNPRDHGAGLWRRAANGEFDWHHDAAAASFARYTQTLVFRVGWEWNVRGFAPWLCLDVALAPDYVAYFRRVVDRLRARLPACRIDWCCGKKGAANASLDRWYPGGDWVDFVGQDKYDWYIAAPTQAEWDKDYGATYLGGPKGIGAWLAYARSKGKKLSVPEWGVVSGTSAGGGDNAFWVGKMVGFFRANAADVAYENYFNGDTATLKHSLRTHPKAGAMYKSPY